MSNIEAKRIVKKYAQTLRRARYPFYAMYLFGSQAHGTSRRWSDIDVAIVSNKLKKETEKNRLRLWNLRMKVDLRIEPHGFTVRDFQDDANPMAYEIRRTGTRVA